MGKIGFWKRLINHMDSSEESNETPESSESQDVAVEAQIPENPIAASPEKSPIHTADPVENHPSAQEQAEPVVQAAPAEDVVPVLAPTAKVVVVVPVMQPETQDEADAQEPESEPEEVLPPLGAQVQITVSKDKMEAFIRVTRPEEGGEDVTPEQIRDTVAEAKLAQGVKDSVVKTLVRFKLYDKSFTVAHGVYAQDGANGIVEDLFSRTQEIHLEADANGMVNYKNLNLIQCVHEGDVICNLIPPTQAKDGYDVYGAVLHGVDGKPVEAPCGKNVKLSEDKTQLIAAAPGRLLFQNRVFCIEPTLNISGNVDNAVGDVHFPGDVVIAGDVCEGYAVYSGKNVTVRGTVEGATIEAGENITLAKGMNGMQKGSIHAGKDITCRFLENCLVHAGGVVLAESILNSTVTADDKIVVEGRRGVIVGGSCTARNSIVAKAVGAMSHTPTNIFLGATPELLRSHIALQQENETLLTQVDTMDKDVQYLENLTQRGVISAERMQILAEKKAELNEAQEKLASVKMQLEDVDEQIGNIGVCRLSCMEIFPPVKITMGNAFLTVVSVEKNRSFYFADGEIQRGSKV